MLSGTSRVADTSVGETSVVQQYLAVNNIDAYKTTYENSALQELASGVLASEH